MTSGSRYQILTANTTWVYISKIVTQILGFIVSVLVIRKLSVEVFGTYNFLISTLAIINIFALSTIISINNRFIPELIEKKEFTYLKRFMSIGFTISIIIFIFVIVILYLFRTSFANLFHITDFHKYILGFFIYIFFSYIKILSDNINRSLLLHKKSSIIAIINSIIQSLLLVIFLPQLTVNLLLYIAAFAAFVFSIQSVTVLIRYISSLDLSKDNRGKSEFRQKRIIRYGLLSSLNELGASVVDSKSDYFIIAAIGNQYLVGIFAFAQKASNFVNKILPVKEFKSIIRPLFFQKFTRSFNKDEFNLIYNFIVKIMIPVFTLPAIYFLVYGQTIITEVLGDKYISAYVLICIILLCNIEIGIFYPTVFTVQLLERVEIQLYSKVIIVLSIVGGIAAMKYFGLIGVVLVTSLLNVAKKVFIFLMIKKKAGIEYRIRELRKHMITFAILLLYGFITNSITGGLVALILSSAGFGIISIFLLIKLHPFNEKDIIYLDKLSQSSKMLSKLRPFFILIYNI